MDRITPTINNFSKMKILQKISFEGVGFEFNGDELICFKIKYSNESTKCK